MIPLLDTGAAGAGEEPYCRWLEGVLGSNGTVRRVAAVATVYRDRLDWVVEAPDSNGGGGLYLTTFEGPLAKERALEYASGKYAGVRVRL